VQVEEKICGEKGPSVDCFERAAATALAAMEKLFLPDFLQSQLYLRFLADLLQVGGGFQGATSNHTAETHRNSTTSCCSWDDTDPDSIWRRSRQK